MIILIGFELNASIDKVEISKKRKADADALIQ
jgi:hypothetical protein